MIFLTASGSRYEIDGKRARKSGEPWRDFLECSPVIVGEHVIFVWAVEDGVHHTVTTKVREVFA